MTGTDAYDARRPRRTRAKMLARIVRWSIQDPLIVVAAWSIFAGLGAAGTTLLRLDLASKKPVVIGSLRSQIRLESSEKHYAANQLQAETGAGVRLDPA